MKVTVYWVTSDEKKKDEIRKYFNIPRFTSLNGETDFEITKEKLEVLRRGEPEFIQIRHVYDKD